MAATTTIMHLVQPSERVVSVNDVYGGTYRLFSQVYALKGYDIDFLSAEEINEKTAERIDERTRLVWPETPTNPPVNIVDIRKVADAAHAVGAMVAVDNTSSTPDLQRPPSCCRHRRPLDDEIHQRPFGRDRWGSPPRATRRSPSLYFLQKSLLSLGPFDCWLVPQGIKTPALRMERHSANARRVAEYSTRTGQSRRCSSRAAGHPGHEIAKRQMKDFGGMVSFLAAPRRRRSRSSPAPRFDARGVARWRREPDRAPGADDPRLHGRLAVRGSGEFIRLSVGIELVDDLIADLEAAPAARCSPRAPSTAAAALSRF